MRRFFALLGKELKGFFSLPLVYFVGAVFLALSGYYFYTNLNAFITFGFGVLHARKNETENAAAMRNMRRIIEMRFAHQNKTSLSAF